MTSRPRRSRRISMRSSSSLDFKCRPDRLNQTHFRSYQAYLLRERKMRPLTVRLHVAALRFFFVKTLKRRYLLEDTPTPGRRVGCRRS